MKRRRKDDHVIYDCRKAEFVCEKCGSRYKPCIPTPVYMFVAQAFAFVKNHKDCEVITK